VDYSPLIVESATEVFMNEERQPEVISVAVPPPIVLPAMACSLSISLF
jgi:hypothetical protein